MFKKAIAVFIIISSLFVFSIQSYAMGYDVYDPMTMPTDQFMVKIFRPEMDSSTFNSLLIVSGVAYQQEITVQLAVLNLSTGRYEDLYTVDGLSKWETDEVGLFFKEVNLKQGTNKIRIIAYKTSMINNLTLGEDLQINDYSITVLSEDTKKSFFMDIMDLIGKLY
jgi:hypothetical protein